MAVARDFRWGRTHESYSSDEALVASYAGGMVEAMQAEGVVATAKHFVGDGGTHTGDDRGDTRLPLETLLSVHGAGYGPAIDAGVMTVMASFNLLEWRQGARQQTSADRGAAWSAWI